MAFKYQRVVPDSPSGGCAASIEKARSLRAGAGTHPLALASGVGPESIEGFLPYVEAYRVASEIETSKYSGFW